MAPVGTNVSRWLVPLPLLLVGLLVHILPGESIHLQKSHAASSTQSPRVGFSIPVHRPKFSYVARFLQQYSACPAMRKQVMVVVVFSNQMDFKLFHDGLPLFNITIPPNSYTALISDVPSHWKFMTQSQNICSWKKFDGIAYMMDMQNGPDYGIIADSELLLFDENDCGENSKWNAFLERIQAREKKREWMAVKVNEQNNFAWTYINTLMDMTTKWLHNNNETGCVEPNCGILKLYANRVTFSWWTDLPWMNLKVFSKMLAGIKSKEKQSNETWQQFVRPIRFSRYDHLAYQYWTILHENFTFKNVTHITGKSFGMSTYLEAENRNNSRVAELYPMWISDRLFAQTQGPTEDRFHVYYDKIPNLSESHPPLLIFHSDLGNRKIHESKFAWEERMNLSKSIIE